MLTEKEIKRNSILIWIISLLLVITIICTYWVINYFVDVPIFPHIKDENIKLLIGIVTTFSITMTGFVAAIGAYTLSISNSASFNLWRNCGYLRLFYHLYAVSITSLLLTFSFCLLMLLNGVSLYWLKLILSLVILNCIHIALLTASAINQAKNSGEKLS
jgi:hypothetical protein